MKLPNTNLFMETKNSWRVDLNEIHSKKRNLYLGLSLNGNHFNKWSISNFIDWGVNHTKEKFAVLIIDMPYAYYNMALDKTTYEQGLIKALTKAEELNDLCSDVRSKLSSSEKKKFNLIRWSNISSGAEYMHNLSIITEEYDKNTNFAALFNIAIKDNIKYALNKNCTVEETKILSKYFLSLMPILISGITYDNLPNQKDHFNTMMHPGNMISFAETANREYFKPALEKMKLNGTLNGILELYVR